MFHRVIASDDMTECFQCGSLWDTQQFDDDHTVICHGPEGPHAPECWCPECVYGDTTARDLTDRTERWHVYVNGRWMAVDDGSNYGFGPVNVWDGGWLAPVDYRHRDVGCDCVTEGQQA